MPILSLDPVVRFLAVITFNVVLALSIGPSRAAAQGSMIDGDGVAPASYCDLPDGTCWDAADRCGIGGYPSAFGPGAFGPGAFGPGAFGPGAFGPGALNAAASGSTASDDLFWLDSVRVGYDQGFVIASQRDLELETSDFPFRLQINGWGQLRYTASEVAPPNTDLNQFQLKRARLVFKGHAFNPDVSYFVQLDGRSSGGDNMRLLDYYLS